MIYFTSIVITKVYFLVYNTTPIFYEACIRLPIRLLYYAFTLEHYIFYYIRALYILLY